MRYALTASLIAFIGAGAFYYSSPQPKALELVQIPNTWIENAAIRSNGDLLMTTIGEGKVYSFTPNGTPAKPHAIFKIEGVNSLSGIVEVGEDVFAVTGGIFEGMYQSNTTNLSLLKFDVDKVSISTVFQRSKYGPINGILALPRHKHIILAADAERGEILRIDTTTGHIEVAIKDEALTPVPGGLFPVGVNGIKIFNDYLYFTNTAHQSLNRVKIDDMGNKLGDFEVLVKLEKGSSYAPDDFAMDRHGNAYVVYWQDRVVKITQGGKQTVLVEGLLAGPSSVTFSNDGKLLYVVTSGQNNDAVSGGQVVEVKL
jgi:sugar lactone lactonase YvrE